MTFNMPWNFNITDRAAIRQQCTIYQSSLAQYLRLGHSLTINLAQDGETPEDVLNLDSEVLTEIDQRVNHLISVVRTLLQEKTDSAACPEH